MHGTNYPVLKRPVFRLVVAFTLPLVQGEEPEKEANDKGPKIPAKGGVSKKQSKSPARPNGGASKRKGKPERAKV